MLEEASHLLRDLYLGEPPRLTLKVDGLGVNYRCTCLL